jgi:hypothetical protein
MNVNRPDFDQVVLEAGNSAKVFGKVGCDFRIAGAWWGKTDFQLLDDLRENP